MEEYIITQRPKQIAMIFSVLLSVFIFSIDYSMLNISLPTVSQYFHTPINAAAQLPMVYILIVTSCLLGFGKLGDVRGYKKVFIGGLFAFLTGTLIASVSFNFNMLLLARVIQALGESMFSPVGLAILTTFLPVNIRGTALGLIAMTQGFGLAIGNLSGGFINAHFTWRGIFLVNVPILIFAVLLALKALPARQPKSEDKEFDFLGAILVFIALATMVYSLSSLGNKDVSQALILRMAIVSVFTFALFILQEIRVKSPLLDLRLFKNLDFGLANMSAFFMIFIFMGFIFLAPFYFELVRKLPVMRVGLFLMIPSLTMPALAAVAGPLSDRIGSRLLCSSGAALTGMAFVMMSLLTPSSDTGPVILCLLALGVGAGLFLAPNNKLVMAHAPEDKQGVASGVYKISLAAGSVFGIALFSLVTLGAIRKHLGASHPGAEAVRRSPELLQVGFHAAFAFGVLICLAAFVCSVLARDKKQ